jgi:hypothetical protein
VHIALLGSSQHLGTREHRADRKDVRTGLAGHIDENADFVQEAMNFLELLRREFAGMNAFHLSG